jgi:hypothetical protein
MTTTMQMAHAPDTATMFARHLHAASIFEHFSALGDILMASGAPAIRRITVLR